MVLFKVCLFWMILEQWLFLLRFLWVMVFFVFLRNCMAYHSKKYWKTDLLNRKNWKARWWQYKEEAAFLLRICEIVFGEVQVVVLGSVFKLLLLQIYFARETVLVARDRPTLAEVEASIGGLFLVVFSNWKEPLPRLVPPPLLPHCYGHCRHQNHTVYCRLVTQGFQQSFDESITSSIYIYIWPCLWFYFCPEVTFCSQLYRWRCS